MNEDQKRDRKSCGNAREKWEERIVAVLLGEADAEEVERVGRAVERDPSLAAYRERMMRVIDTVRTVHSEGKGWSGDAVLPGASRLSEERRRRLERLWNGNQEAGKRPRAITGWRPLALAAGLLLLLGGTAYFATFQEEDAVLVRDESERAIEVEDSAYASDILRDATYGAHQWAGAEFSSIGEFLMTPDGGRLDAFDEMGEIVGPVPLKHTDVDVRVSGHFTRVNVTQRYHNPYDHKIEAVYTFPLSHRGAVDRMTMTVGNRVVIGEVKERGEARRVYEAARQQGHVTSLLEQERANIFTQSVANIEPGAEVIIEIRYVEVLESVDGEYRFDFPTVVAPRYTPGRPVADYLAGDLPDGVHPRTGVILPAPATIDGNGSSVPDDPWLRQFAVPINGDSPIIDFGRRAMEDPRVVFTAEYESGEREAGMIFSDGVGQVGSRWFYCPPRFLPAPGEPFAMPTDQVPDADRVTPMPVKPDQRAGHDLDIRVSIDTGGPGIRRINSVSHEIERADTEEGAANASVALAGGPSLPNRDFRLAWHLESDEIEEAFLTHTGGYGDFEGGFFTLILQPPERVADEDVRPRELIFVLDQSGSMSGAGLADRSALDAAKDVINRSIDTMRPNDRFNIVSFNNSLDVLWTQPRENTDENRALARRYIDGRQGGGGTEMRNAVLRALWAAPFERPEPDADTEGDDPMRIVLFVTDGLVSNDDAIIEAVRNHAHETRVFTIGMSHAPNRHLLDGMARVGRGAVDYVLPENDVEPIVQRFADRIATPVLTDIVLDFGGGLEVTDVLPSPEHMTDLFDFEPLVIHGRYATPGEGTLTLRGRTGAGPYARRLDITFPEVQPGHDVIATLWAREKVGELMREGGNDIPSIVRLGENFQIVTRHTSFVAVERQRVTIDGEPVLVRVPIEFPKGMSWEGIFGVEVPDEELVRHLRGTWEYSVRSSERAIPGQTTPQGEPGLEGVAGIPSALVIPEFQGDHERVRTLLRSGRAQYVNGDLPGAEVSFRRVEALDPNNPQAKAFLRLIQDERASESHLNRQRTRAQLLEGAPDAWRRPQVFAEGRFEPEGQPTAVPARAPQPQLVLGSVGAAWGDRRSLDAEPVSRAAVPSQWSLGLEGQPLVGATTSSTLMFEDVSGSRGRAHPEALPHATYIIVLELPEADSEGRVSRLRELLHGDGNRAEVLVRVVHDESVNAVVLIVPESLTEFFEPFAEKLGIGRGIAEEERLAEWDRMIAVFESRVPDLRRNAKLYQRLDDSLYERLMTGRTEEGRVGLGESVEVAILLSDLAPATLTDLERAGLDHKATADDASFVIGSVPLERLESVALLNPVRWIEPVSIR